MERRGWILDIRGQFTGSSLWLPNGNVTLWAKSAIRGACAAGSQHLEPYLAHSRHCIEVECGDV